MGKEVHAPLILKTIEVIQALTLPCQDKESDWENLVEFLCEDCPYDVAPKVDCGLALLHDKARIIKLALGIIGTCPDCGSPATHPSGLCRDCHQAKLERGEI